MTQETGNAPVKGDARRGGLRKFVGVLLAAIGLFWLAHNAGWMGGDGLPTVFWPAVVVAVGLSMFFGSRHRHTA